MRKLTLTKDSRLYRYYRWSLRLWLRFTNSESTLYRYDAGDNFCHMVRTITVYPVVVVTLHGVAVWWCLKCLVGDQIAWYGAWPYTRTVVFGLLGIGGFVGLILGLIWSVESIGDFLSRRASHRPEEISTMKRLVRAWAHTKLHDKICPWVDFGGEA